MVSTKTMGYIAVGGAMIVGIYWFYKNAMTEGAQKALSGGLGGFGGSAKNLLGELPGIGTFMGKGEAQAANQAMSARPSPVQPHSTPYTGTGGQAIFPKGDLRTVATPDRERRSSEAKRVATQTSSIHRFQPGYGRQMMSGVSGTVTQATKGKSGVGTRPTGVTGAKRAAIYRRSERARVSARRRSYPAFGRTSGRQFYGGR